MRPLAEPATELGKRIRDLRLSLGFKERKPFAEFLGLSASTVGNHETGLREPTSGMLAVYKDKCNVSLNWLITGEGNMKEENNTETGGQKEYVARLPIYDITASAGYGDVIPLHEKRIGTLAVTPARLRSLGASPQHCCMITARGDSMSPTIPDGSDLVVDLSQREIVSGWICVINVGDSLLVKRIDRHVDGSIRLISDNSIYSPQILTENDAAQVNIIGRVVYFGRPT